MDGCLLGDEELDGLVTIGELDEAPAELEVEHVLISSDAECGVLDGRDHQRRFRAVRLHRLDGDSSGGRDLRERGVGVTEIGEEVGCRGDNAQAGLLRLALAQLGAIRARRPHVVIS